MIVLMVIFVLALIIVAFWSIHAEGERQRQQQELAREQTDRAIEKIKAAILACSELEGYSLGYGFEFAAHQAITTSEGSCLLASDDGATTCCAIIRRDRAGGQYLVTTLKVLPREIIAVELEKDSVLVTTTNTGFSGGGVGIGTDFGTLGVGSLGSTSQSVSAQETVGIRLRILLRDLNAPAMVIPFGSDMTSAQAWFDRLRVLQYLASS